MFLSPNYNKLYMLADLLHDKYKSQKPFPHICLDNFFSKNDYKKIKNIFPGAKNKIWKTPSNRNTQGKSFTIGGKNSLKEYYYDQKTKNIFREFNSSTFLHFLERISGIKGLIPDPYFYEGGFLNVHADFSHHDLLNLERRINILIYLNDNWKDHYNGQIKFYDKNIKEVKCYSPIGNRLLIFTTSDQSYHGHPERLNLPKNVFRKSIALYYYSSPTKKRKKKKILFPEDKNFVHKFKKV